MIDEEWSQVQFNRITKRLQAFHDDPDSLSEEVRNKCRLLNEEIEKDSKYLDKLISDGVNLDNISNENPERAALVEWLARTP